MALPQSDRHVYGHLADPQGHRRPPLRSLVGASSYPSSASLFALAPDVMSQGKTGRCVGFAKVTAIYVSGKARNPLASPTGLYRLTRAVYRVPNPDNSLPRLTDDGCMPSEADHVLAEFGVSDFDPLIDGPTISPEDLNAEPTQLELERDSSNLYIGSYSIDQTASDLVAQVARSISSGYAVTLALPDTDDGFERYTGGVLSAPNGRVYGGHELVVLGYEITPDGRFYLDGQNSWDTTWGLSGRFRGDEIFMRRCIDIQAMRVTKKAA